MTVTKNAAGLALAVAVSLFVTFGAEAKAAGTPKKSSGSTTQSMAPKPTIVLVHGAFADGSSWQYVIPMLQRDGYNVIAVQNPLSSLAEDIATTKRFIDAKRVPVVVVGHSYGGVVITGAASGNPNVKALVYIAASAPEENEPVGPLTEKYPTSLGTA